MSLNNTPAANRLHIEFEKNETLQNKLMMLLK